jgi:regulatory protein
MVSDGQPLEESFCVTSVEQDRKNRRRYHIYTDGREEPVLTVHEDILIRFKLFKDQWVTPEDVLKIKAADGRQNAYALAIAYLGAKPRTRMEIERYLTRKLIPPEIIPVVIERLEQDRLLNDGDYAKQFANQRVTNYLKGSRLIKQELMQRGIGRNEAAEALDSLDPEAEREAALKAARKKWPSLKGEPREKRYRLIQFLTRRGYPGDVIKEAIKGVDSVSDDDDERVWLDN